MVRFLKGKKSKNVNILEILPNYNKKTLDNGFPYESLEACAQDLMAIVPVDEAQMWANWIWEMCDIGEFQKATCLIFDIVTKFVSICKGPAVQSSVWLTKNKDSGEPNKSFKRYIEFVRPAPGSKNTIHTYNKNAIFCCVLEPSVTDGNGELYPPWEVERTAHDFLKNYNQMDLNHDEWAGAGRIIESWIPKTEIEMLTLKGDLKTYKPFSWFVGFEPGSYEAELIEKGELDGLSIGGEWPKIIFPSPGVKTMDESEKKFFEELLAQNEQKTADLLTKQAEAQKKATEDLGNQVAESLKPLADIKSLLEQKPAPGKKEDETPSTPEGGAGGVPPATGGPTTDAPAAGTQPTAPAPAQDPATGTTSPPATGSAETAPPADGSGDIETPDQKVIRLQAELKKAEESAKLKHKAESPEGSPSEDKKKAVVTDVGASFKQSLKKGKTAKITRQ